MRTIIAILCLLSIAPAALWAADDKDAMLAWWDGGGVSVAEYLEWVQRIPEDERPALTTLAERQEFLQSMINAKLMIAAAESIGIDQLPDITDWVRQRRSTMLKDRLMADATAGRVKVSDSQVDEMYNKRLMQIKARHIITKTLDQAKAIAESLKAGVPFEDLAKRHSTCASAPRGGALGLVRWGDFSDRWSTVAFGLEPGQYSEPFPIEDGYAIVKVESKNLMEPADPEAERQGIRAALEKRATFAEQATFLDSLKIAYDLDVDVEAVVNLCARYAEALTRLGITSAVIDQDVEPTLTERERTEPIATYRGGEYTTGELVETILDEPYPIRPRLDDVEDMISMVNRQMGDTLLIAEAETRHLGDLPEIAIPVDKIRQRRLTQFFYRYITEGAQVPEDTLRSFFNEHGDQFKMQAGHTASKIVVRSREAADSIMTLLDEGVPFEDLAKERSVDPFTAPNGGAMGFLAVGRDPEFDGFFEQMEVGETRVFRSLEGFVVLRLQERHESRIPTFEEAREVVERTLLPSYRDRMLQDWLATQRETRNLKINEDLLGKINLSP